MGLALHTQFTRTLKGKQRFYFSRFPRRTGVDDDPHLLASHAARDQIAK